LEKHKEKFNKNKVRSINYISFLIGFSQAAMIYVLSTYFKEASGTENVGSFYLISYALILIVLLNSHKLTRKLGKGRVFIFSILIKIIANILLLYVAPSYFSIGILVIYLVAVGIEWANLDVILESFSKDNMSGRIRGLHLTIINLGFLLGPFISTRILDSFGFHNVFLFSLFINIIIFISSIVSFRNISDTFSYDLKTFELIKKVSQRKDIIPAYYISFILEFFYALMIIYTSIYLGDLGFSWKEIGFIFTIMLIPFVLIQYPAGILADKKIGEKKLIVFALLIMAFAVSFCMFESGSLIFWCLVLFLTRIGAALVEILRDSYFFKRIDGRDVDLINFFRTATPVAYIIASIVSSVVLLFFPVKAIFLVLVFFILSAIIPALRLKKG